MTDLKQTGDPQEFETGAHRDSQEGKGRPSLLPALVLYRWGILMQKGEAHYDTHNWEKGIPLSRWLDSAFRHLLALMDGSDDEDHASALLFNAGGYMWTEEAIRQGKLPKSLDDLPRKKILEKWLTDRGTSSTLSTGRAGVVGPSTAAQLESQSDRRDRPHNWGGLK